MKRSRQRSITVIEKFLFPNPQWQDGYRSYSNLFGKPIAWIAISDQGSLRLVRLDRKGNCTRFNKISPSQQSSQSFLVKYAEQLIQDEDRWREFPSFFKDSHGKNGMVFAIQHLGRMKALLFFCSLRQPEKTLRPLMPLFGHFLSSQVEIAYKTFELNNFYETVHPRALALSTMHSVHRVISSSLRLHELLPRIGRLSAQVLKAKGCSIMLVDPDHEFLLPYFSFGENRRFVHHQRIRIGRGLQGRIASSGNFHIDRRSIAVPFIEDDIVGLIALWDKHDGQPFTKIDLEILKSLSEQAVVAIKNARLFEETEQLTLGTVQTINHLLEDYLGERQQLPAFREIVIEMGKDLQLSSRELTHLDRAILLLDTGALSLPDKVWQKKERLTKKEYQQVKRIPMKGANLLRSISSLQPVVPIILHHREWFDGSGYPQGLKGEQIPIGARIVSVVNSFVAMISKRPYRQPMTMKEALSEIDKNRGTQFDPKIVDCFSKVIHRKNMMGKISRACKATHKKSALT